MFHEFSGSQNFTDKWGGEGVSSFSVENFLSHNASFFPRGTLHNFNNVGYRKSLVEKVGGIVKVSVENFLSHSAEKFRRATLLRFKNFLLPRKFLDKGGGKAGRREGVSRFSVKKISLTVPKSFLDENIVCCVS